MAKKKLQKGSWLVTALVTVRKEIVCDNCTLEEAEDDSKMWGFAVEERQLEMTDWEIEDVEAND